MSVETTVVESRTASSEEQVRLSHAKTHRLLLASFRLAEHKALKEHMNDNQVQQNLDGTLAYGIKLVTNKKRTMSDVAPTLKMLLQYGAKWDHDDLPDMMTPYHVICGSTGDHHELLELMIKELGQTLVNTKDDKDCTALLYAVQNANIKCAKVLIGNGADVNLLKYLGQIPSSNTQRHFVSPLIDSINLLHPKSPHSYDIMMDIFNLLLDSGADVNIPVLLHLPTPIIYAATIANVTCVKKLIQKGAQVNYEDNTGATLWTTAARAGSLEVLKYLIEEQGFHWNSFQKTGCSVLYWTVVSGNTEAIRFLLNQGITTTTYIPQKCVKPCDVCTCSTHLVFNVTDEGTGYDPVLGSIDFNMQDIIGVMERSGCQLYQHTAPLMYAVQNGMTEVVNYLLTNYKYLINFNYNLTHRRIDNSTLLTAACRTKSTKMIKLLLEHGSDPNICNTPEKGHSTLMVAIIVRHVEIIARFIRGGLNVNTRVVCPARGIVLPFEAAVWKEHIYAAEMLLVSGCSRGVQSLYNNQDVNPDMEPEMKKLLKEWNVHKNNVLPLQQKCRMVILNHLSPQADQKIPELPLPQPLIKYLGIPELDDIIETFKRDPKSKDHYVYSE